MEGGQSCVSIDRQPSSWVFQNKSFYLGNEPEGFGTFRFEPVMKRITAALEARCVLKVAKLSAM